MVLKLAPYPILRVTSGISLMARLYQDVPADTSGVDGAQHFSPRRDCTTSWTALIDRYLVNLSRSFLFACVRVGVRVEDILLFALVGLSPDQYISINWSTNQKWYVLSRNIHKVSFSYFPLTKSLMYSF